MTVVLQSDSQSRKCVSDSVMKAGGGGGGEGSQRLELLKLSLL